jgi:M6 family metalloprotease-like protein
MKKIYLFIVICFFPLLLLANFAQHHPFDFTQPDGKRISLFATGDEFYRIIQDEKGFTVLLHPETGFAVYAIKEGNGLKASGYQVGSIDPATLGIAPNLTEDSAVINEKVKSARAARNYTNTRNNTTGQWNNLVVFIRFVDQTEFPSYHSRTYYNTYFNATGSTAISVKKFFLEESGNQLTCDNYLYPNSPNSYVVSFQDSHPRSYYSPYHEDNHNGYSGNESLQERCFALVTSAINFLEVNNQVPENLDLDSNNDGIVDNVSFVIRGEPDSWGCLLWPMTWWLDPGMASLNGEDIKMFNFTFDDSHSIGTQCHEMSHSIGFPDLYHYDWHYANTQPVDKWDLMGIDAEIPQHSLVYMKYKYGHWCSIPTTITTDGIYNLNPVTTSPFAAYKINSTWPNQYYIVEYRKQEGLFESSIYGSGLIVYRINTSVTDGDRYGPPDEVYVYRPNGSNLSQGYPEYAFYSAESGHTTIHSYTDPAPRLSDWSYDGGLILAEVGSAGSTISFKKRSILPKIWAGYFSDEWEIDANWLNGLPTSNDDVEIPNLQYNDYPVIRSTFTCKNMHISTLANIDLESGSLIITQDFSVNGQVQISGVTGISVFGDTNWEYGSTVNITNPNAFFDVRGDMTFAYGSNVQMTNGRIDFGGITNSSINVYSITHIQNVSSYKSSSAILTISSSSTKDLYINGGIHNTSTSIIKNYLPGILHLNGFILNDSGGLFNCYAGTISFESSSAKYITCNSSGGSDFYNIIVAMSNNATLNLNTAIKIKRTLYITNGILQTNDYNIEIQGNWNNTVGETGFIEGSGQVIFSGTLNHICNGEHFNTLVLNKSSGELVFPESSFTRCISFDWTAGAYRVNGGNFLVDDLVDDGICGTVTLDSGTIEYHQDSSSRIDLSGILIMHGGNFNLVGGSSVSYWAETVNAGLTMTDGVLDFLDKNIVIRSSSYTLDLSISGGTIKTQGYFTANKTGVHFNGGTIELYGTSDVNLTLATGNNIYNLNVNKGSREEIPTLTKSADKENTVTKLERANKVTANSTAILINGILTINLGTFDVNGKTVTATGGVIINGQLQMNATGGLGTLISEGDIVWNSGSTSTVSTGNIQCKRNWKFNSGSTARLTGNTTTLNGVSDAEITSSSANSWFGNLLVAGTGVGGFVTYNISSTSTATLMVKGTLGINPTNLLSLCRKSMSVDDAMEINSLGKLTLGPDAILSLASAKTLTVNSGGTFEAIGNNGHNAKVTHQTGYYDVSVESGGTISAQYATFEYMNTAGVNVKTGALINTTYSFHYCTFQNGVASGRLMTINNSQTLSIYGANFPTNTWSGSNNVSKSASQGYVTFINATGGFAGESYDGDLLFRIFWTSSTYNLNVMLYDSDYESLYVCDPVTYNVTIYNNSTSDIITPIRVDVYYNRTSAPVEGEIGDQYGYINSLAAGSWDTYTYAPASSVNSGIWKTWFRVDTLNEIAESDENNNAGGYLTTTWNELPVVPTPTMTYYTEPNILLMSWTYPISVNQYKIYRSTDPNGSFTELVGTSIAPIYTQVLTGSKYFYRVTAERNWP